MMQGWNTPSAILTFYDRHWPRGLKSPILEAFSCQLQGLTHCRVGDGFLEEARWRQIKLVTEMQERKDTGASICGLVTLGNPCQFLDCGSILRPCAPSK